MAISFVKKAFLVVHREKLAALLEVLQKLGIIHLESVNDLYDAVSEKIERINTDNHDIDETLRIIADLQFSIQFLKQFEGKTKSLDKLMATFMGEKVFLNEKEYNEILCECDYREIINQCKFLEEKLHTIREEKRELSTQIADLVPWTSLSMPLQHVVPTNQVLNMLGVFKTKDYQLFKERIRELTDLVVIQEVSQTRQQHFVFIAYHSSAELLLSPLLKETNCDIVHLQHHRETANEAIRKIEVKIKELEHLESELLQEARSLYKHRKNLMVYYDHFSTNRDRFDASCDLSGTRETVMVSGWIAEQYCEELQKKVLDTIPEVDCMFSEPSDEDDIPIVLKNNAFNSPFESVIKMYGMPNKKELDPTPFVAPFFALFFGICLTDAGYGLLMMLSMFLFIKYLNISSQAKSFFKLFFIGGIFTVLSGLVTGGWFGIDTDKLPGFLQKCILIKPLDDPVTFLAVCLGIGFMHLWFGLLIGFIQRLREGSIGDALFQKLTWMCFLPLLVLFGLSKTGKLPLSFVAPITWALIAVVFIMLVFSGRKQKNIIARLGIGAYTLYSSINFLADTLSYSRLMAFGLATGCIAMVVNLIASMVIKIPLPLFNIVIVVLLLVVGHIGNIAINTLGGFVHTARLQFLEFFSKFFIGEGRFFKPFKRNYKFVNVENSNK